MFALLSKNQESAHRQNTGTHHEQKQQSIRHNKIHQHKTHKGAASASSLSSALDPKKVALINFNRLLTRVEHRVRLNTQAGSIALKERVVSVDEQVPLIKALQSLRQQLTQIQQYLDKPQLVSEMYQTVILSISLYICRLLCASDADSGCYYVSLLLSSDYVTRVSALWTTADVESIMGQQEQKYNTSASIIATIAAPSSQIHKDSETTTADSASSIISSASVSNVPPVHLPASYQSSSSAHPIADAALYSEAHPRQRSQLQYKQIKTELFQREAQRAGTNTNTASSASDFDLSDEHQRGLSSLFLLLSCVNR